MKYENFEYIMIIKLAQFKYSEIESINIEEYYSTHREYNSKSLEVLKKEAKKIYDILMLFNTKYCTILDENYPIEFRQLDNPPLIFYYMGNIDIINEQNKISIIGSRDANDEQLQKVIEVSKLLSKRKNIVVSGLAKGVDYSSQINIVEEKKNCIAVLPCSFDNITPKSSKELYDKIINNGGLVISEYYPTQISRVYNSYYIARNRLIMALGSKIIIGNIKVDSSKRGNKAGGTGTAIEHAILLEKPIYYIDNKNYIENEYKYFREINAIGF